MNNYRPQERSIALAFRKTIIAFVGTVWGIMIAGYVKERCGWIACGVTFVAWAYFVKWIYRCFVFKYTRGLSVIECYIPMGVSVVCGIILVPFALLSGNVFSIWTCIASGIVMTLHLLLYRGGKIGGVCWLIAPTIVFAYELLPVDLPTDVENILIAVVNIINFFCAAKSGMSDVDVVEVKQLIPQNIDDAINKKERGSNEDFAA